MKVVDITGLKFGCLTPIKRCGSKQTKNGATALWECLFERIGMSIGRVKRRITTLGGKHVFTG